MQRINSCICLQVLTYCMLIGLAYAIIGDKVKSTKRNECAYVVSISHTGVYDDTIGNLHFCTGTLLTGKSVLTAAHCLWDKRVDHVEILAGSVNLLTSTRYYPESWITYDQWKVHHTDNHMIRNDIAVIHLKGHGIPNTPPMPILAMREKDILHEKIKIAGWGNTMNGIQPFHLRSGSLNVVPNHECSRVGAELKGTSFTVPKNYFCSKADPYIISTCGDGGAPILVKRSYLTGINIGACPKLEGNYTPEFLNRNLFNSHLYIYPYREFLDHVTV